MNSCELKVSSELWCRLLVVDSMVFLSTQLGPPLPPSLAVRGGHGGRGGREGPSLLASWGSRALPSDWILHEGELHTHDIMSWRLSLSVPAAIATFTDTPVSSKGCVSWLMSLLVTLGKVTSLSSLSWKYWDWRAVWSM